MPVSRCQGQAAGLGGSAEIFLLSLCSPAESAITKTAATTGKALNIHFLCNLQTTSLSRIAFVRHDHMYGSASTSSHTCLRWSVRTFWFYQHIHFFFGPCMASDVELCNLFPLESVGEEFPFWRKRLVSGQPSPEKIECEVLGGKQPRIPQGLR